jgi:hypothetical protein
MLLSICGLCANRNREGSIYFRGGVGGGARDVSCNRVP